MVILGGRGDANAVRAHLMKRKVERGLRGFGHEAAAGGVFLEPIAELARAVQMHARLEPDDADERATPRSRTVKRTARPASQSEAQASVKRWLAAGSELNGHPREPLLEVRARAVDRAPQLGGVARLDGAQKKPRRLDGVMRESRTRGGTTSMAGRCRE